MVYFTVWWTSDNVKGIIHPKMNIRYYLLALMYACIFHNNRRLEEYSHSLSIQHNCDHICKAPKREENTIKVLLYDNLLSGKLFFNSLVFQGLTLTMLKHVGAH